MDCTKLEYYQNTGWQINYAGKELTSKNSSKTLRSNLPFGELFVEQRSTANYYTPYKFSGKEKDEETSYSYFGARYYLSDISIWASVDPMADKAPGWTPYRYCFQNPIGLIDPDGRLEGDNDDGFIVDVTGNFTRVDDTGGDKYDVIYSNNSDGTPNMDVNQSQCVEKGVLNNIGEGCYLNNSFDILTVPNEQSGEDLFKFLVKNTSCEWGNTKLGNNSYLTTSHQEGAEYGGAGLLFDPRFMYFSFKGNDHSHPNGDWQPSGSSLPLGDPDRRNGDIGFAMYAEEHFNSKAIFRVYDKKSGTFFQYDSKTYLPRTLDTFIVRP